MATFSLVLAFTNFRPGPTMFLLRGSHDVRVVSRDESGLYVGIQCVKKETKKLTEMAFILFFYDFVTPVYDVLQK
jgi:hypothetical protein